MIWRIACANFHVYDDDDLDAFAQVFFLGKKQDQPRLYATLRPGGGARRATRTSTNNASFAAN